LLEGHGNVPALYTLLQFCATWRSAWTGLPAGVFAPSLAIGAGFGRLNNSLPRGAMIGRRAFLLAPALLPMARAAFAQPAFDHAHSTWDALLKKHVRLIGDGNASQVDYRGFAADRAVLTVYLKRLSAVTPAQYGGWSRPQRYAFLANAYNAFTVEKVLTRYPDLTSIRDFGRVFGNPWRDEFFTLLGARRHLDWIEHETMRAPGVFDDPRVHVAVNCASIGCPMLGRDAFVAEKLDAQLDDLFRRFMSDRTRNRYNAQTQAIELSQLFDWYRTDFEQGHRGFASLHDLAAKYAEQLADGAEDRTRLRSRSAPIRFIDYDWSLNDLKR
jgi:hypothetical protein